MRSLMTRLCLLLLPLPAMAAAITGMAIEQGQGGIERLRFNTDQVVTPLKVFTLGNPDRVVIDLPPLRATGVAVPPGYNGALVKSVRFGQFDGATSRIVVDLARPAKLVGTLPIPAQNGQAAQLLVDIAPFGTPASPAPAAQPTMAAPAGPFSSPTAPVPVANAPVQAAQGEKPLIIIDAGHGGQDPGALGLNQTREKNVTLAFAKALKDGLLRTGRYRVALTREDDTFVMLPERVNIARKLKGDIFISLHADSNPRPEARGLSVYTLSETASDDEAAALADRENKSDIISGLDLNTADEDVASILIDLAQRETMNKASILAEKVVENLHPKVTKLPNPHRFAGFRVLKAPDIPSILIEIGFLSNADDEKLLTSKEYQSLVVSSVINAVDAYRKE
jgi:N-acetylmuramoyl-L-alanine amidase